MEAFNNKTIEWRTVLIIQTLKDFGTSSSSRFRDILISEQIIWGLIKLTESDIMFKQSKNMNVCSANTAA